MAISRTTTAGQHPFSLIAKKQFRPTGLAAPQETSPNLISEPLGNNFYKLMALLLLMMSGCNEATTKKEGESPMQQNIVANPLNPISEIKTNNANIDRRLSEMKKGLFDKNLLLTLDELGDLHSDASKVGKGLLPQMLIGKRLEAEVLPVLWHKVFLEGPDKVIVAEFTEPGSFEGTDDFGRGLRLILRKQVGNLNISTLLFLDYDEKTRRLAPPRDFFFNDPREITPDIVRVLMDYDVQATPQELKGQKRNDYGSHLNSEFFGTTISVERNKASEVIDFHIRPVQDDNDAYPLGRDGKTINSVSMLTCTGCHESREGFASRNNSFEKLQRDVHLPENQDSAIKDFLKYVRENKRFDSTEQQAKALGDLERMLRNPKENLHNLLPLGFLQALEQKQSTFTRPSSVLNRYNAIDLQRSTKTK